MTATTTFDLLERLASLMRIWNRQHPRLAELHPIQVSALIYLSRCNRYSDTPLAVTEYLGLTKGTVSQSLKALAAKGLIEKRQDPLDRRSVHLQLTAPAHSLLEAVVPPQFLIKALMGMGERAQDLEVSLADLLREIQRNENVPGFGLCKTCSFHQHHDGLPFCGLTQAPLQSSDAELICREHLAPQAA